MRRTRSSTARRKRNTWGDPREDARYRFGVMSADTGQMIDSGIDRKEALRNAASYRRGYRATYSGAFASHPAYDAVAVAIDGDYKFVSAIESPSLTMKGAASVGGFTRGDVLRLDDDPTDFTVFAVGHEVARDNGLASYDRWPDGHQLYAREGDPADIVELTHRDSRGIHFDYPLRVVDAKTLLYGRSNGERVTHRVTMHRKVKPERAKAKANARGDAFPATIMLAIAEDSREWDGTPYDVRSGPRPHQIRNARKARAMTWRLSGTRKDLAEAKAWAAAEGWSVFVLPVDEPDPIGKAKELVLRGREKPARKAPATRKANGAEASRNVTCSLCHRGFIITGDKLPRHYYGATRYHTGSKHACDGVPVPLGAARKSNAKRLSAATKARRAQLEIDGRQLVAAMTDLAEDPAWSYEHDDNSGFLFVEATGWHGRRVTHAVNRDTQGAYIRHDGDSWRWEPDGRRPLTGGVYRSR